MPPESLVRYTRQAAARSMYSASVVSHREVVYRDGDRGGGSATQFALAGRAERSQPRRQVRGPRGWRLREPLRQPALGGAVGGAGTHADDGVSHTKQVKAGDAGLSGVCAPSRRMQSFRKAIENNGAAEEFQIVEAARAGISPSRGTGMARVSSKLRPSRA